MLGYSRSGNYWELAAVVTLQVKQKKFLTQHTIALDVSGSSSHGWPAYVGCVTHSALKCVCRVGDPLGSQVCLLDTWCTWLRSASVGYAMHLRLKCVGCIMYLVLKCLRVFVLRSPTILQFIAIMVGIKACTLLKKRIVTLAMINILKYRAKILNVFS